MEEKNFIYNSNKKDNTPGDTLNKKKDKSHISDKNSKHHKKLIFPKSTYKFNPIKLSFIYMFIWKQ